MLLELAVADFAIIEQLSLRFAPGLNVLTGETGAGKSIIIDAVNLLLGGRGGGECIRSGSKVARIEGIFALTPGRDDCLTDDAALPSLLDEYGIPADEDTIILSREIQLSGRTTARINGRAVPVSVLQQFGRTLVDIHGQGEHLSILRVDHQLGFLDRVAALTEERRALAAAVSSLRQTRKAIDALVRDEREIARRLDLLSFQVSEIDAARLVQGEEDELLAERILLANAEQLSAGAAAACDRLQGSGREDRGVLDAIGEAIAALRPIDHLDATLSEPLRLLAEAADQLGDITNSLRRYQDSVEFNPERLAEVEERLALINRLKRKYGASIAEILRFADEAARERDAIGHGEEQLTGLRQSEAVQLADLGAKAEALSVARRQAAKEMAAAVERELADLRMAGTRFEVAFERNESADGLPLGDCRRYAFDLTGIDRVGFLIAPNAGEPLRSLAKTASGGETARFMLALKTVLARADPVATLIFDEIDVGIGGRSGQIVGSKLWRLSKRHQVLCVTHLPQIACFADQHFQIAKSTTGDRTTTSVTTVDGTERVAELVAMLGGSVDSLVAQENALELLRQAEAAKANLVTVGT